MGNPSYTPPTKRELIEKVLSSSAIVDINRQEPQFKHLVDRIMDIVEPPKADIILPTGAEEN
jgi:ubiquinone biosynthesis protein COQ9